MTHAGGGREKSRTLESARLIQTQDSSAWCEPQPSYLVGLVASLELCFPTSYRMDHPQRGDLSLFYLYSEIEPRTSFHLPDILFFSP